MTIYSKRRGRRSLAAILAAMLVASVLAVVAGSPAQAANTAGEYLVDHDDNASTAMVREFAGADRYDTAVRLAKRFVQDRGGRGSVSYAFVASGESLVDAVSVSGLAGYLDAPVLLTRGAALHGAVEDFIEDYGISNVHVLGGAAAVSDAVETELKGLVNKPKVTRISGADRYATSAAIASQMVGESWCGTNANSAILASGHDDRLFDAIAIGPVANRLELPVLLTAADEVPDSVLDYIDENDVEHVQIVGGTDSVSAAVATALTAAGVDTVERTDGDSPGELSVAIAKLGANGCGDDLSPVSNSVVALVNSDNMIDGITAAPVLADDEDQLGGGLIPIMAVGDTLPASVRDWLAATPAETATGAKIHMRVLAVGGTAAVSDAVMKAAVDAAGSADSLTVKISGSMSRLLPDYPVHPDRDNPPAGDTIYLHFSDDAFRETTETIGGIRNRLEDILLINGVPADIVSGQGTDATCVSDIVPVQLARDLRPGDEIEIAEGTVFVGANGDRRIVRPTKKTVTTPPQDRDRPVIEIVALDGHTSLYALAHDPAYAGPPSDRDGRLDEGKGLLTGDNGSLTVDGETLFEVTQGDVGITGISETKPTTRHDGKTLLTFTLGDVAATANTTETGDIDAGDRFRANRGALMDLGGPWPNTNPPNDSQVTTRVATKPVPKLRVASVQMSELRHFNNPLNPQADQPRLVVPSAHRGASAPETRNTPANPAVWLEAKADGAAAGAFGNSWSVRADKSSNWSATKPAEVRVYASERDRRIGIRIVNGEPRFADLKKALEENAVVNKLFLVKVDNQFNTVPDPDVNLCRPANDKLRHADLPVVGTGDAENPDNSVSPSGNNRGSTMAAIHVNFNGWVESISSQQAQRLLTKVLEATVKRNQPATGDAVTEDTVRSWLTISSDTVFATADDGSTGPVKARRLEIVTGRAHALPQPRDLVKIGDGFQKCTQANVNASAGGCQTVGAAFDSSVGADSVAGVQRTEVSGSETSIANGYGDNGTANGINGDGSAENDFNYGSESRIVRSSAVQAPHPWVKATGTALGG